MTPKTDVSALHFVASFSETAFGDSLYRILSIVRFSSCTVFACSVSGYRRAHALCDASRGYYPGKTPYVCFQVIAMDMTSLKKYVSIHHTSTCIFSHPDSTEFVVIVFSCSTDYVTCQRPDLSLQTDPPHLNLSLKQTTKVPHPHPLADIGLQSDQRFHFILERHTSI